MNKTIKGLNMTQHIMSYAQFRNYVENGVDGHPDDLNLGDWTMEELFKVKDLDIVHDILKVLNEGWEPCNAFSDWDNFVEGVLGQSCIVGSEKYIKVPMIEEILKRLWKDYYNPCQWSLGEYLDKWVVLYQMGKKDKIGFTFPY
tara:strand:+ start:101 stop:532 length:432 start_codon:yes stop_codon:yes gene_type:complete